MSKFCRSRLFFCFSLFIFHSSLIYGQGVNISGKLNVTPHDKKHQFWFSTILIKQDGAPIGTGSVDTSCRYTVKIKELKKFSTKVDIFIARVGMDTSFIKSVFILKNANVNCDLYFPNPYNRNVLGDITCPKCGKTDMVVPITHGWTQHADRHIKYGDTSYTSSTKGDIIASDTVDFFDPREYCKRCKIKF